MTLHGSTIGQEFAILVHMKSLSLSRPHALIMAGIPGSGKTHFAKQFSDMFGTPIISPQEISNYAGSGESASILTELFLREIMKTKESIIIDAGGETQEERIELAEYLTKHGYTPLVVWVQTDPRTAKKRALRMGVDSSEFHDKSERFIMPHERERPLVISGKHTYVTQARAILKRVSAARQAAPKPVSRKAESTRPVAPETPGRNKHISIQ